MILSWKDGTITARAVQTDGTGRQPLSSIVVSNASSIEHAAHCAAVPPGPSRRELQPPVLPHPGIQLVATLALKPYGFNAILSLMSNSRLFAMTNLLRTTS